MTDRIVDVPEAVRRKATAHGPDGKRWLDTLGNLLDELEEAWQLSIGPPLHGGSEAYVATVRPHAARTLPDDLHDRPPSGGKIVGVEQRSDAVIKVAAPWHAGFTPEVRTLLAARGRGYARLLDHDEDRRVMLLERLGSPLSTFGLPVVRQLEIVCETLREAWRVPAARGLMSGAAKARWLAGFIGDTWRELDRPCSERVVERALGFAAAREAAFDPATAVLVHGDAHSGNLLQSPADPATFKLIDPDGLFAEPAYDLAIPMRGWNTPLLAGDTPTLGRGRCAYLGDLTGVDRRAIWEWGFVERVSTGLLLTRIGAEPSGRQTLEVAERFCRPS